MNTRRRRTVDTLQRRIEEKKEVRRKCEILLRIYEEGRIEKIKTATSKYKSAARAALEEWLEYADEPKPDPAMLLQSAGFDPEVLDLQTSD